MVRNYLLFLIGTYHVGNNTNSTSSLNNFGVLFHSIFLYMKNAQFQTNFKTQSGSLETLHIFISLIFSGSISNCHNSFFRCAKSQFCIPMDLKCDGTRNCGIANVTYDHSDEEDSTCTYFIPINLQFSSLHIFLIHLFKLKTHTFSNLLFIYSAHLIRFIIHHQPAKLLSKL